MDVFFQMRFSYCGKPQGVLSRGPKPSRALNEAEILRQFDNLERLTLPSLRDQQDPAFRLVLLTSARMPEACKNHLTWLLNQYLPGRSEVLYARPMIPGRVFRRYMQGLRRGDTPVIQTQVLDGDAFGKGFVQQLREHGIVSWARGLPVDGANATGGTFMSFRRGLYLGLERKKIVALEPCTTPPVPFGLSLVARPSSRYTPMLIDPNGLGGKFPHLPIRTQNLHCLRAVTGAGVAEMPAVAPEVLEDVARDFGILRGPHSIRVTQRRPQLQPTRVDGVVRLKRAS